MASGLDEVVFRATERLEILQLQTIAGANHLKELAANLQRLIIQAWNNPEFREALEKMAETARAAAARAVESAQGAWRRVGVENFPSPVEIVRRINVMFSDRMWRHSMFIFVSGVMCGSIFGVSVGWYYKSRIQPTPHWKALHSLRDGTAVISEYGAGASLTQNTDVIVKIHSFSVQHLDRDVLRGRGRRLRNIVRPNNIEVTVGRSFSGMIMEMGTAVSQLEIGDEVWGALSEWEGGAAQEMIVAPVGRVGRSPQALLPEAAASLPYCGAFALHYLGLSGLNERNAKNIRVLIVGAEIGAGCVILQLLKNWGAVTTAVCDRRAQNLVVALGAQEVEIVDWCDDNGINDGQAANLQLGETMVSNLSNYDLWDAIFLCRAPKIIQLNLVKKLLKNPNAFTADLRSRELYTDRLGYLPCLFYKFYITIKRTLLWLRGINTDIDFLLPVPMDVDVLDTLATYVENGVLQTVVDKVYTLKDFQLALTHACGMNVIGCTVVRIS